MSGTLTKEIHQPIRFIIVGGSVAGLCAAYTLRQSGHDVVVVDKRDEEVEVSTH
jgi:2-polyprenyl-6-methoxyphenol hydroxylase-like FAD-dependent oxidoreductase